MEDRPSPKQSALVSVKPQRRRPNFVSTARREVHGEPPHRIGVPPTLQGFFYGGGDGDGPDGDEEGAMPPPRQDYGKFVSLPGSSAAAPPVDPSFSFLTNKLPGTNSIFLLDSCNGLLLFGHIRAKKLDLGYIVCNPATEQWAAVPGCHCWHECPCPPLSVFSTHTYLVFDPAVSSHFHLVLFWEDEDEDMATVHTYASETGEWSHSETDWTEEERQGPSEGWRDEIFDKTIIPGLQGAFVNGMLHFILEGDQLVAVDAQGKTRSIIPAPPVLVDAGNHVVFIGQSQGSLHCITEELRLSSHTTGTIWWRYGLSIWVLQDYDTHEWVLKHSVSYMRLFGKKSCVPWHDYYVVAIHPDCNLVFFVQHWNYQLISYDIDHQELRALDTFEQTYGPIRPYNRITPYVPYFSELFLGVMGAHK